METMTDLGVTGILEMPPAGTLTGIAKRALKGVETFALKTPDQLDDARAFCAKHGEALDDRDHARPGGWWSRPAKGTFHRSPRPPTPTCSRPAPPIGDVASLRDRTERHRRRTAARSSSGSSRTATWSPPASRWSASTRREQPDGRHRDAPPARRTPRILGIGSYRPSRVVPNAEIVDAIDSSDEWIQQRSGIKQRRWADRRGDRADDVGRGLAQGPRARRHRRPRRSTA